MSHRYLLQGIRVTSDWALEDLQPDHAAEDSQVQIRTCSVPTALEGNVTRHGNWHWNGQQLLLSIPDVARFLITARDIRVDPDPAAEPDAMRSCLLGSAWAACCHQRDVLILHASAAVFGSACIALMGNSGAGKSTLAALLAARGHIIAADDTCVLSSEHGMTRLHSASSRLKLWRDALPILGETTGNVSAAARQPGKFQVSLHDQWSHGSLPVHYILLLENDQDGSTPRFERLSTLDCMRALAAHTFRSNVVALLGRQQQNFALSAAVAATTEVHRWIRPWGIHRQHTMLAMLEDWVRQRGSKRLPTTARSAISAGTAAPL